ncbi:MAG: hypothetical protein KF784_13890 [Fimbriimonadaceae bacterium]|nr:hypothetical protein [Fimbriimonadaceae bacterium]
MICIAPLIALTLLPLNPIQGPIDIPTAKRYFQEAKWISDDDDAQLWGKPLYGPMIFVHADTRTYVTNQRPPEGEFSEQAEVFLGKLSDQIAIANTAIDWAGSRWTMVMWPLPSNRAERATLMIHELFHRIQPELGIPGASPQNAQMETKDGRLWLQLELKALSEALLARTAKDRDRYAKNALEFRQMRYRLFPKAKVEEDQLELNEGLAEFTGYMMRGGWEPESRMWMSNQLNYFVGLDTYSRRFAYKTGPAYALLLNVREAALYDEIRWRKTLTAQSSLAGMLAELYDLKTFQSDSATIALAKPYGYDELLQIETDREKARLEKLAAIRKRMIEGPVLLLPFEKMRVSFDPQNLVPLDEDGTYYPTATIIDEWGTIEVTDGVLIAGDWRSAKVVAPASGAVSGPGWTLKLKTGWKIVVGKRKGDFTVVKG